MKLIAAADKYYGIGKDGMLLFSLKQDMKFFRETTMNHVVVMGRRTLDSFPGGKPLKNRVNIVLTRNENFSRPGVTVCTSPEAVLNNPEIYGRDDVFIIGGAQIYNLFMPYCDEAYITEVNADGKADTFLKDLRADEKWVLSEKSETLNENGTEFCFTVYKNSDVKSLKK